MQSTTTSIAGGVERVEVVVDERVAAEPERSAKPFAGDVASEAAAKSRSSAASIAADATRPSRPSAPATPTRMPQLDSFSAART